MTKIIDADGHVVEPRTFWQDYVEPKYRERLPRIIKDANGIDRIAFGDRSANSIRLEMAKKVVRQMQGEQDHGDLWFFLGNLTRGFETVHHRHGNVHDDHVGMKLKRLFHRFLPVVGFSANAPAGLDLKQIANSQPHDLMVVGDQNPDPGMW